MIENTDDILNDESRLLKMEQLNLLDGKDEEAFDRLTRFAVKLLNAPISYLSLITPEKQILKSCIGFPEPYQTTKETPTEISYCQYVVKHNKPLIINDARTHDLVKDSLGITEFKAISYIGIPLVLNDGTVLGSFCVADLEAREWTSSEIEIVTELAQIATTEIDLRSQLLTHKNDQERLVQYAIEQESMELMQTFVQDTTHEFKTPISTIKTKIYLLSKMIGEDEQLQAKLQEVETQADRINQLVDSLLTLTRIDQVGQFEFNKGSINDSLRIVQGKCSDSLTAKSARLTLNLDDTLPIIAHDNEMIVIALTALVENAIQHIPDSDGEITITSRKDTKSVMVDVHNNGDVIPANELPRIFKRFYRNDHAHNTAGLGLGLTIAKKIIEQHNGAITVKSNEDEGTIFTITLPVE